MTPRKKKSQPPKGVPHAPDRKETARKWTRKEAEQHVLGLGLRCLGPRDDAQMAHWQRLMEKGKVEEARTVQTRTGCGYDVGQTVLEYPFDGADHETTCPKCGTVNRWRSPTFDGLTAAGGQGS